ncbi:hypothetical protein OROMI_015955 [Orobanche minor]
MESPFSQSPVRLVQESVDFVNETWVPETMPDSWIPCSPSPTREGFESLYFVRLGDEGWTTTSMAAHSLAAEILQPETEPPKAEMTGEDEMSPSMWRSFLAMLVSLLPAAMSLPEYQVQVGPKSSPGRPKSSTRRPMSSKSGDIFTHGESEWHDDLPPPPGRLVDD